jgi:hypothetical protein
MKYTRFFGFVLIAALITAVLPFPKHAAQAASKPSGWDFGLTKQCVRSPLPGQTNYYEDLSGCGSDTSKSYVVGSQAEVDGGLWNGEGTGPASQMFGINVPRSPLSLRWADISNGRKSATFTTNFDANTAAVKAGVFTWFALLDHEHGRGGPIPRVDQLQTKATVTYNPKMSAGASRAFVGWQGFYNGLPYQVELNFHITDNWGDNFPQYPEVVDMFNWPAGSQGKFLNLDARYINIPGLQSQMTVQPSSPTTLTIEWNRIIPYLIDRGFLPPIPGNDYANTDSTSSFIGTEVRTDAAMNAGNVALTVSNFENSELEVVNTPPAPPVSSIFSPAGGSFTGPTRVTFTRRNVNSTIYYTTDGSTPTTSSRVLRGSGLFVNRSLTLSAIEMGGKVDTTVSRADFIIEKTPRDGKSASVDSGPDVTEDGEVTPTLTMPLIYAPSADEKLSVGQTKQVMWNSGKGIPANVKLELYQNDACIPKTSSDVCTTIALQKVLVADKVANNGSYTWTIPSTIPGLLLNRPVVLVLSGAADGAYLGQSAQFTVASAGTTPPNPTGITITQTGTAAGEVNKPLAIGFQASPQANYNWSVDGIMPSGLTLSEPPLPAATTNRACSVNDCPVYYKNTAIISGAPKATGTYNITVLAKNEAGVVGKLPVTITVTKAVGSGTTAADYTPGINFKYRGNPTVYYLDTDRTKMAYPSLAFLRAWGVRTSDIVIMPDDVQFPDSPNPMPLPNGTLLKVDGDQTVYQLDGGKLRAFTSSRAFTSRGNQFSNIYPINQGDRARLQYDTGDVIQ